MIWNFLEKLYNSSLIANLFILWKNILTFKMTDNAKFVLMRLSLISYNRKLLHCFLIFIVFYGSILVI